METGIVDRMFFVIPPEEPKPPQKYQVPVFKGAMNTRKMIDNAVAQGVFKYEDDDLVEKAFAQLNEIEGYTPRCGDLVEKLALFFAIDLGRDVIDSDCLERAVALMKYRLEVLKFLAPVEAEDKAAALQQEIRSRLRRGPVSVRELKRDLHYERYAIWFWNQNYTDLKKAGEIVEYFKVLTAGKAATFMVGLVKDES
jgi:hypothetical protein